MRPVTTERMASTALYRGLKALYDGIEGKKVLGPRMEGMKGFPVGMVTHLVMVTPEEVPELDEPIVLFVSEMMDSQQVVVSQLAASVFLSAAGTVQIELPGVEPERGMEVPPSA